MKPHQMVMDSSVAQRIESGAVAGVASRTQNGFSNSTRNRRGSGEPSLVPPRVRAGHHTLILTGELDRGSARTLEAEIERLCEEGVSGITLDLRKLAYIDSIGVAVIVFRSGLCHRRGYEFALIPGSRFIHGAFEQAGVTELLSFQAKEVAA
jgi:anti-anti-sigma factor